MLADGCKDSRTDHVALARARSRVARLAPAAFAIWLTARPLTPGCRCGPKLGGPRSSQIFQRRESPSLNPAVALAIECDITTAEDLGVVAQTNDIADGSPSRPHLGHYASPPVPGSKLPEQRPQFDRVLRSREQGQQVPRQQLEAAVRGEQGPARAGRRARCCPRATSRRWLEDGAQPRDDFDRSSEHEPALQVARARR